MSAVATLEQSTDLDRMQALQSQITQSLDDSEVRDVAEKSARLREWLKATKAASDLRIAAVRLECTALRRLALLWEDASERPSGIHASSWKAARGFASLEDDEFERLLDDLTQASSPGTLYRQVRHQFEAAERDRRRAEGLVDFVREVHDEDEYYEEQAARGLRDSATTLIEALDVVGKPFTVASAAVDLGAALTECVPMRDVADWQNDDIQSVLRDVVRDAITHANDDVSDVPRIITYHDQALGFVRVPSSAANLSHLLAMAAFRRKQADEAVAAAAELEGLCDRLAATLEPDEDYSVPLREVAARSR